MVVCCFLTAIQDLVENTVMQVSVTLWKNLLMRYSFFYPFVYTLNTNIISHAIDVNVWQNFAQCFIFVCCSALF